MAFNQDIQIHKHQVYQQSTETLAEGSHGVQGPGTRFDELSSTSADTAEWILFSPSMNEVAASQRYAGSDVLSTSGNDHYSEVDNESQGYMDEEEDDDDIDDASLLDSLEAHSPLRLSLPRHDGSGQFGFNGISEEDQSYLVGLARNDYITNRIDSWRREQARILIDDLNQGSQTSGTETNDLLASWGVEDSICLSEVKTVTQTPTESAAVSDMEDTYSFEQNKRFYGDDIFKGLSAWEVDKIKSVAKQMSSSLKTSSNPNDRDDLIYRSQYHSHISSGRRLSILLNLSRVTTNKYLFDNRNQPFWKQDISSAQSSLSLDTNSIMFGNLHIGDVI